MQTNTLVIGGGLSGLSLAWLLQQQGIDYRLIEARSRLGGRILSKSITGEAETGRFDLGPAWFWPGQPRMARMLKSFNLESFHQYSTGDIIFEDEHGRVNRNAGFASMEGSYRVAGGFGALIDKLAEQLPKENVLVNQRASRMERKDEIIHTEVYDANNDIRTIQSSRVVLAIPPRIAAERISFSSDITQRALHSMRNIATWMAGHAKILAVYDKPFWRQSGLSGDGMSRLGPMVEIHDASCHSSGPYALFGFVGYPADVRQQHKNTMLEQAQAQLVRMFGEDAAKPVDLIIQDWAQETHTATSLDHAALNYHPRYGLPRELSNLWDGHLIMGSTEVAQQFGGYLEGALEAAEITFQKIQAQLGIAV